jgi:hypothetical protein
VLLAGEERDVGQLLVQREGEGEADARLGPVGGSPLTLKREGEEVADTSPGEESGIGLRVGAVEDEHGRTFPAGEMVAYEGAETEVVWPVRRDEIWIRNGDELEESGTELDDVVLGTPRWRLRAPTVKPICS